MMMMPDNTHPNSTPQMVDWKFEALNTGWRVFPISITWDEVRQKWDKVPLIKDWQNLASSDPAEIETMPWDHASGYGVATGPDCYVLDQDDYKEGSQAGAWLASHGMNGATRIHQTASGGFHWIYRLPPTVNLRNRNGIVHGLDARGSGGFIAFGNGYQVVDNSPPAILDPAICAELDRPPMQIEEQDDSDFTLAPLDPVLVGRVETLKTHDVAFKDALCGPQDDRSKALLHCARVLKMAGFTSHEYVTVIMELSEGPRAHVEERGRRALRALKRFWAMAGPSPAEMLAKMPKVPAEYVAPKVKVTDMDRPLVEGEFILEGGKMKWCVSTALAFLETHRNWDGVFAFNEFVGDVVVTKPIPFTDATNFVPGELTDNDIAAVEIWFNRNGFPRATESVIVKAIQRVARQNVINPPRHYLEDLHWDGNPRLTHWLVNYMGAADNLYTQEIGKRSLIGAVARVLTPGCKLDTMVIFEGRQGIKKSSALRVLAGEEYFADSMPDLKNKDAADHLRGIWIVEMAELEMVNRASMETTKAFLSRCEDRYRPAYGKGRIIQKRRCIFFGTTNQDNYLRDETGSRRFWPVAVTAIALEELKRDRDQLWAEAVHLYRQGERWWLSEIVEGIAVLEQKKRGEDDPWESRVVTYVENRTEISIREILVDGLNKPLDTVERKDSNRVAAILKRHRWERDGLITSGKFKDAARYRR